MNNSDNNGRGVQMDFVRGLSCRFDVRIEQVTNMGDWREDWYVKRILFDRGIVYTDRLPSKLTGRGFFFFLNDLKYVLMDTMTENKNARVRCNPRYGSVMRTTVFDT